MPLLFALAGVLGLSESGLKQALIRGDFKPKVHSDFMGGVRSGVNGTPSFFINGERHDGTYAFEDLSEAIDARLPVKTAL
jgi:protein-disulfide isomerase